MKKRMLAWLLVVAMMLGQVPVSAFAVETTPVTGEQSATEPAKAAEETTDPTGATEETGETGAPTEETSAPTEESTAPAEETSEPTEAVDEAVAAVEGAIAALPALDVLEGLEEEAQYSAYEQAQSIADAYDTLTEEQQGKVSNFETLKAFLEWFAIPEMMGTVAQIEGQTTHGDWKEKEGKTLCGYCGYVCDHSAFDSTTGKCSTCQKDLSVAKVTTGSGESAVTKFYQTFLDAYKVMEDSGATLTLLKDVSMSNTDWGSVNSLKKAFTFDLNSHSFEIQRDTEEHHTVDLTGKITVKNGTIPYIRPAKEVELDGVKSASVRMSQGSLTVKGNCDIETLVSYGGTLKVSGGKIKDLSVGSDNATVTLSGGTFGSITRNSRFQTFSAMLQDGYAFQNSSNALMKRSDLTDQTELDNVTVVQCTTHTAPTALGLCGYCGAKLEASVTAGENTTYYASFSDALAAAAKATGSTLKLLRNVTGTTTWKADGTFTLDLNGKELHPHTAMQFSGGDVTIVDSGSNGLVSSVAANHSGKVTLKSGTVGTLSLDGGTVTVVAGGTVSKCLEVPSGAGNTSNNTLNISGGQIKGIEIYQATALTITGGNIEYLQVGAEGSASITVTSAISGGTFGSFSNYTGTVRDLLAEGYAFHQKSNGSTEYDKLVNGTVTELKGDYQVKSHTHGNYVNGTCPCGYNCPHTTVTGNKCSECGLTFSAQLWRAGKQVGWLTDITDEMGYIVDAIQAGDTIKLVQEGTVIRVNRNVTFDLNGYNCEKIECSASVSILDSTVTTDAQAGGCVETLTFYDTITLGKGTSYRAMNGNYSSILFPEGCGLYKQTLQNQFTWVQTVEENTSYAVLRNPTNDWTITFADEAGNAVEADELVYGNTYTATANPGSYVPKATRDYIWKYYDTVLEPIVTSPYTSPTFKFTCKQAGTTLLGCEITINGYKVTKTLDDFKVQKADIPASYYTAPKPNTLFYKGIDQELVTAGTVKEAYQSDLYFEYGIQLGQLKNWSEGDRTKIPTGMNAGDYQVIWRIVSKSGNYKTYEAAEPIQVSITNNWTPVEGTEFIITPATATGWVNQLPTIAAQNGYQISARNLAGRDWTDTMIPNGSEEGTEYTFSFYLKNRETGAISQEVKFTYKLDRNQESTKTVATVSFSDGSSWNGFTDATLVTFDQLFKEAVTVTVKAKDLGSGVAKIEYAESDKALTLEQVQELTNWSDMSPAEGTDNDGNIIGTKTVAAENNKQFVCYIRITDNVGNVTYLSTSGATFDTQAPEITGVTDGETAYTTRVVQITDKHPGTVTLNNNSQTLTDGKLTLPGDVEKTYTIVATDKVGNATTVTVKMLPISSITAGLDDLTVDNANSGHGSKVRSAKDKIKKELANENATSDEKAALNKELDKVNALLKRLEDVEKACNTDNIQKVKDITADNVKLEDKTDLEKAKADLNKALKDYDKNLSEAE